MKNQGKTGKNMETLMVQEVGLLTELSNCVAFLCSQEWLRQNKFTKLNITATVEVGTNFLEMRREKYIPQISKNILCCYVDMVINHGQVVLWMISGNQGLV